MFKYIHLQTQEYSNKFYSFVSANSCSDKSVTMELITKYILCGFLVLFAKVKMIYLRSRTANTQRIHSFYWCCCWCWGHTTSFLFIYLLPIIHVYLSLMLNRLPQKCREKNNPSVAVSRNQVSVCAIGTLKDVGMCIRSSWMLFLVWFDSVSSFISFIMTYKMPSTLSCINWAFFYW